MNNQSFAKAICHVAGSLASAFCWMVVAAHHVTVNLTPSCQGVDYAALASNPFPASSPVAYRVLTPLLAWITGFRGDRIVWINLTMAGLLVATVCYSQIRNGWPMAVMVSGVVALTMPTLFTLGYAANTDSTTYLLMLLAMIGAARPWVFWPVIGLAFFNRESLIFALPFLVLFHLMAIPRIERRRSLLIGAAALAPYLAFRVAVSYHTQVLYGSDFYFRPLLHDPAYWLRQCSGAFALGIFSCFQAAWLIIAAGVVLCCTRRDRRTLTLLAVLFLGVAAQSVIAVDVTRMWSLAFPALLLCSDAVLARLGTKWTTGLALACCAINLILPPLMVTSTTILHLN